MLRKGEGVCTKINNSVDNVCICSFHVGQFTTPMTPNDSEQNPRNGEKLLNVSRLAKALGVGRFTVQGMKRAGYLFIYGKKTTEEHAREWLALPENRDFIPSNHFPSYQKRKELRRLRIATSPPSVPDETAGS